MNVELEILKALELAHPRALKRTVLISDVQLAGDGVSATTVERKLGVLETKGQVRLYEGEDVTRIKITTDGLDRLAESR
jgi:Fe2+ or Zn2+ uptake regulation protein